MPEQRILLIEDEPTTREIFSYVLREAGYVADAVGSAGAATTCLNTIQYTLVIADWLLPDGNGIDLADAACDRGAKTLIISSILSSLPSGAAERHELLTKPLAADEILAAVRRAIGNPDAKHG